MKRENQHNQTMFHRNDVSVYWVTVVSGAIFLTFSWFCSMSSMDNNRLPALAAPKPVEPIQLALEIASMPGFSEPLELVIAPEPSFPIAVLKPAPIAPKKEMSSARAAAGKFSRNIPFHGIIVQVAGRYDVDPHLVRAIIFAESGYNPKAKSKKGAQGLMQLMPTTARVLGVKNVYDPEENIDGGVRYFRSLLDRFDGDVQLALAAYNAGARHVRNYEGIPPFRATQLYIEKVLKFQQKFKAEADATIQKLA